MLAADKDIMTFPELCTGDKCEQCNNEVFRPAFTCNFCGKNNQSDSVSKPVFESQGLLDFLKAIEIL